MSLVLLPAKEAEYRRVTLEDLWNEAETLGEPQLSRESFGKRYSARIMFRSRFGLCFAKGEDDSVHIALGKAIDNARQLGAGQE